MAASPSFIELCAKTNYAFLEGASHPEEMLKQAKALGYPSLGITDPNGFYGIPRAHTSAKLHNMKLIIGTQISEDAYLLVKNKTGYANLCEWLSTHTLNTLPISLPQKAPLLKGTILLALPTEARKETLRTYKDFYGEDLFLVISRFCDGGSPMPIALSLARRYEISCVASNQPLFHLPSRKPIQDVLRCVRHGTTLSKGGFSLLPNAERFLKNPSQMQSLFYDHPEWLSQSVEIAERCDFSLDEIHYHYPGEWIPKGLTADTFLEQLVREGLEKRYGSTPSSSVEKQVQHELRLIKDLSYADYFLTTWDIVRYARSQGILCQGRGSAANSIVCYLLGITSIDPIRMNLLFERFISKERKEPPDIDIDFEHERREEVIQYLYKRYGRSRAAITATVICYRRRSALREVAKTLEVPLGVVEKILSYSKKRDFKTITIEEFKSQAEGMSLEKLQLFLSLSKSMIGFPRHLGTHTGGFVLSHDPLNRNVPIQSAAMPERTIIQWDKNDLEALGFVKVDVLGLGILTAIRKSFTYLKDTYGIEMDLATVPAEDPKVYEMLQRADTVGVFQIESRAQMSMLPRLKPKDFFDLVIEIALVRPGPIQGEMVHPYLRRRTGKESVTYPHPSLEKILGKTYGVPLFQEQIMQMAIKVAGFTAGEADQLRRSMGSWRRWPNRLAKISEHFRKGLIKKGIAKEFADNIFSQIQGFAEYGFPESHSASFAILAYTTAYLKCYYPDVFLCALLNSQPMGFYSSHSLIFDGKHHGVHILPIRVGKSSWDNKIEKPNHIRLGYREISGLPKKQGLLMEQISKPTTLLDFVDQLRRLNPNHKVVRRHLMLLAAANAFKDQGLERRKALWEIQALDLVDEYEISYQKDSHPLPSESPWERAALDYQAQGVSLYRHPVAILRPELESLKVIHSKKLNSLWTKRRKTQVRVAGMVICRQMPSTASGVFFVTLEDEFGFINLVFWNKVFEKYRAILLRESFIQCTGLLEKAVDGNVYHVIANSAAPLMADLGPLEVESHDFH